MVVIIVIGVVAGFAVPHAGRSLDNLRVDAAARRLADALEHAHHAAVATGRVHALAIDRDGREIALLAEPDAEDGEARWLIGEAPELEPVTLPADVKRRMPEGIELTSISVFEAELVQSDDDTIRILFFPDGTTEFANIELAAEDGLARRVRMNGLTGAIRTERVDPGEESE
jgi:type II secretory pathway pseudopilin PulG